MSIQPLRQGPEPLSVGSTLFEEESHFRAVARRLRRLTLGSKRKMDPAMRSLLEDLLDAAAATEQTIADQRLRIIELECLSSTDGLTGLLNRRGFEAEIERALARAKRHGEQGLLVVCDLDEFKAINDSYGHPAGDAVLRGVAELLRGRTRASDSVSRPGGDEFGVLLTDTPPSQATALAGELSVMLDRLLVPWGDIEIPVTASLGAAAYDRDSSAPTLHLSADSALYRHKRDRKQALRSGARR